MSKSLLGLSMLAVVLLAGCSSGAGTAPKVTAQASVLPTVTLSAAPSSLVAGATTTLNWSSTGATACTASGAWSGPKLPSDSGTSSALNKDSTFTLTCRGAGGTAAQSVTVSVQTTTLSAAPSTVASGGSSLLTWNSTNATACTGSGGAWSGSQGLSGTASVGPITSNTIYTLACSGPGGIASASTAVTVPAAPTVTLTANPSAIASGGSSTLSWSSMNANTCATTGGWTSLTASSGTAPVGPLSSSTSYTLTCTGPGGPTPATATVTVDAATVTASPRVAALTLKQTQQFTATAPGAGAVTWSVDGIIGGNATVGTINATGLYVPPQAAGLHSVTATSVANTALSSTVTAAITDLAGVYTYHNDLQRTGQNLQEYALTQALVSGGQFGKRWSCPLDGDVYAQPLYVANLTIAGATHNVVFVATNHDSVYAFDGDNGSCTPLWQTSFLTGGATTIPASDYPGCNDFLDEYGIVGTPVIDPVSGTLYVVASTKESGNDVQRLHALNITTGSEQPHSPQFLAPTYTSGSTQVQFDPSMQLQRAGLVNSGGGVYVTWSSHCDIGTYYGWMARYDGATLMQTAAFNVAPNGGQGGIWMSGAAPAVDPNGSIYLSTGNGSFTNTQGVRNPASPNDDFSMSFLSFEPTTLTLNDFYTPSQEATWSASDYDISAPGVMVLPDGAGPFGHSNLLYGGDKQGHIWLLDRVQLGEFSTSSDNVVQMLDVVNLAATGNNLLFAPPAYFNGRVYAGPVTRPVQAMALSGGLFPSMPNSTNTGSEVVADSIAATADSCDFPGCGISISAAGLSEPIAWALDNGLFRKPTRAVAPAVLRAYDAANLTTRLFTSDASANDTNGGALKFTLPMIANGHVYVGGTKQLTVYGIAP